MAFPPLRWLQEAKAINPLLVELANEMWGTTWVWPEISGPLGFILDGPSLALLSIIVYNWWVYTGYDTVIYLAGLGNIPHDLYEAASIDGAGRWTTFRSITIPLLSPTIFFLAIMATIGTFKAFNSVWVMYEPLSRDAVDTASILIFQDLSQRRPVWRSGGHVLCPVWDHPDPVTDSASHWGKAGVLWLVKRNDPAGVLVGRCLVAGCIIYLVLIAGAFTMVLPFFWMISTSLMTLGEANTGRLLPRGARSVLPTRQPDQDRRGRGD